MRTVIFCWFLFSKHILNITRKINENVPFQNFYTMFHRAKVVQSWAFQKLTLSKVASFKGLNRKEKKKNQTARQMVSFTRRHFQKLDL